MTISIHDAKIQAEILKQYLKQSNSTISHSSCLHAVARMNGYKDWNTMSALLSKKNNQPDTDYDKNPIYADSAKISNHALISFINEGSTGGFDVVCYKIILFILSELKKNSVSIPDREIIRKSLWNKVSREDFNRSFELLLISNFILKRKNESGEEEFFLNPNWFWKGDDRVREKFLQKFYESEFNDDVHEITNKEYVKLFVETFKEKSLPMNLSFDFDHFGREKLVANCGCDISDVGLLHSKSTGEILLDESKQMVEEYVENEAKKIFSKTAFKEGVNSQWCDNDYYLMEYVIDIHNKKLKESLNYLYNKFSFEKKPNEIF